MSAPPPPDWVGSSDLEHRRDPILDSDRGRVTRAIPRVILEGDQASATSPEARFTSANGVVGHEAVGHDPAEYRAVGPTAHGAYATQEQQLAATTYRYGMMADAQRRWRDISFSLLRRDQLLAVIGFVVLSLVVAYALQRGALGQDSGSVLLGGPSDQSPAGPGLISDPGQDESRASSRRLQGKQDRSSADFDTNATTPGPVQSADADNPDSSESSKIFAPKNTSGTKKSAAPDDPSSPLSDDSSGDRNSIAPSLGDSTTDNTVQVADDGRDAGAADHNEATNDTSLNGAPPDETRPGETSDGVTSVRFESCAEASAAGAAPIPFGAPGYRLSLDADNDGLACENGGSSDDGPVSQDDDRPTTTATTAISTTTAASTPSIPISSTTTTTRVQTTTSTSSTTSVTSTSSTATVTTPSTTTSTTKAPTTEESTTTSTTGRPTTTSISSSTASSTVETTQTTVSTTAETTTTERPATTTTEPPPTEPPDDGPGSDGGQTNAGLSGPA